MKGVDKGEVSSKAPKGRSLQGIFVDAMREEFSLLKNQPIPYVVDKLLEQVPIMPNALARKISGIKMPLPKEGENFAKAAATYYARMKRLEERKNVSGFADRALRESLMPINESSSSVSSEKLKEVMLRMKERNVKYTGFIRQAALRRKAKPQTRLQTAGVQRFGESRLTKAYRLSNQRTFLKKE